MSVVGQDFMIGNCSQMPVCDLANYKNISKTSSIRLEFTIVQPGLSKEVVNE